jgi:hypothetical protein
MLSQPNILCRTGNNAAYGEGLEREATYVVFQRYLNHETTWFQRAEGGFLTIRTLFPLSSSVPPTRLLERKRLGAICGLLMINGQYPGRISPAIFQYLIHGSNFHSLNRTFIGEWFPNLRTLLLAFHAAGPEGDLSPFQSHFVTYHDVEVSHFPIYIYYDRSLS